MSVATETEKATLTVGTGLAFGPTEYCLSTSDGVDSRKEARWRVKVRPDGHMIAREVWYDNKPWDQCDHQWEPEEIIWPAWPTRSQDEVDRAGSPLAGLQEYWSTVGNRLRDSAKWTATVLGAALAAIVGTSPLAGMREQRPQDAAIILGSLGLVFLGVTMLLVIQVMRPQSVSFTDVQCARQLRWPARRPLVKWLQTIESQRDLYLPCGIRCLSGLRQSMIIEEITLMALSRARATARDQVSSQRLGDAQTARAARLVELRIAAARIATVGEYYKLRYRSSWATYAGVVCGLLATATIVAAFAWPLS